MLKIKKAVENDRTDSVACPRRTRAPVYQQGWLAQAHDAMNSGAE
jgi:hypothetical protein